MSEVLLGIAQLAVAVAGFSGLLFYFGQVEEFDNTIKLRLNGLLTQTASAAIFSLVGLLAYENLSGSVSYAILSGLWVVWYAYAWFRNWSTTSETTKSAGTTSALYGLLAVSIVVAIILIVNIVFVQTIELFLTGPVFSLALSIVLFLRIINDLRIGT